MTDSASLGFDPKMAFPDDDHLGAAALDDHQEETPVAERVAAERPALPRAGDGEAGLELSSLLQNENALDNDGSLQSLLAMEPEDRVPPLDEDPLATLFAPATGAPAPSVGAPKEQGGSESFVEEALAALMPLPSSRGRDGRCFWESRAGADPEFVDSGSESDPASDSDSKCEPLNDSDEELIASIIARAPVKKKSVKAPPVKKAPVRKTSVKKKLPVVKSIKMKPAKPVKKAPVKKKPKVPLPSAVVTQSEVVDVLERALGNADFSVSAASLCKGTVGQLVRSGGFKLGGVVGLLVLPVANKPKAFLLYKSLKAGPAAP